MNERLQRDSDALWSEVTAHAGMLERRALNKRKELFYELLKKHFSPVYFELAALKGKT